ncbi:uroporphyrinogen-III C-methyltransferase [Nevskia soli]|uniref:uroporphyrinogen-III C-methyltransferase n=1 Tax=Nevskia soli TaxID=418856 RepID=UPI0015D85977|nr:uroporphyrinogen-III C-methyltransferase [Nevskia soli]
MTTKSSGRVFLVGAGPGDPELITLKGRRALERATVVFYDHLAPVELLDFAPASAVRLYVGKKRTVHALSQQEISTRLIEYARAGETVVRLKGGDPYLFGRGGEEAEALAEADIPFEVIPGVSSPAGIGAYAGIPLTHREHTSAVSIVTGHDPDVVDWNRFAHAETLVILMGLSCFDQISERVIRAGRAADTPAAAVRWGTRADQQVLEGTLASLPKQIHAAGMKPPATIIVGPVVRLRSQLSWFEKLPLFGQRIVVTRPRGQAQEMCTALRDLGAEPIQIPAIAIEAASDTGALDRAIEALAAYDWLIFTSVNGVRAFFERLDTSESDLRALRARIAVIGPATRQAVEAAHLKVDVTGDEFVAESLAEALDKFPLANRRVLLVRAAVARDYLPEFLRSRNASVDVVEAYRTVAAPGLVESASRLIENPPDWITFTSSSTVDNFFAAVAPEKLAPARMASIGPVTSATLRKYGIEPAAEAVQYTTAGLVAAICASVTPKK